MKKENIENTFNIGIPCYNYALFDLQDTTKRCYIKGYGNKAIDYERCLRNESLNLINDNSDIKFNFKDGLFHYLALSSNISDSNTNFGFNDTTKLCSLYTPYNNIYGINDLNINNFVDKKNNDRLSELYKIKDILLSKDYTELEKEYFRYLSEYSVDEMIITKYCEYVVYLAKKNYLKLAQKYLFLLSGYLKVYKNMNLNINGEHITLKDFINHMVKKYNLKNEYLLRSGFLGKSYSENDKIIESIINKKDIHTNKKMCFSGIKENDENVGTNNDEPSNEEIINIDEVLNDRRMFYLSHNPVGEIIPNGSLSNYGAFIYNNGIIVADRLYGACPIGILPNDALYKFNSLNFEDRIKLSKQELTKLGNSKFYHTDTWKDRTSSYINSNTSEEMKENVKKLIK